MAQAARPSKIKDARRNLYFSLLIEAGERIFARDGYATAKVQDIAHKAGLSLGTFYSVFEGKDELYNAIHELRGRELADLARREVDPERPAVVNLLLGIAAYFLYFAEHREYLRMHVNVGNAWALETGMDSPAQMTVWREGLGLMTQVIAQAIGQGDMVDEEPSLLARILSAGHQARLADWLEREEEMSVPQLIDNVLSFMANAYLTPRGRKTAATALADFRQSRSTS